MIAVRGLCVNLCCLIIAGQPCQTSFENLPQCSYPVLYRDSSLLNGKDCPTFPDHLETDENCAPLRSTMMPQWHLCAQKDALMASSLRPIEKPNSEKPMQTSDTLYFKQLAREEAG